MKSKQQAIQEAWGKYWDEVKDNVNGMGTNGGWADNDIIHYNEDLGCDSKDFEFAGTLYRPKSLSGIENNNGWTRIENESDLPKVDGKYKVVLKQEKFEYFFEMFWCPDEEDRGTIDKWLSRYSHWKPLEEEKAPIY